jgi:hypothetical protein
MRKFSKTWGITVIQTVGGARRGLPACGSDESVKRGRRHIVRSGRFSNLGKGVAVREDSSARVGWELSWDYVSKNQRMSRGGGALRCPDQFQLLLEFTAQSADLLEEGVAAEGRGNPHWQRLNVIASAGAPHCLKRRSFRPRATCDLRILVECSRAAKDAHHAFTVRHERELTCLWEPGQTCCSYRCSSPVSSPSLRRPSSLTTASSQAWLRWMATGRR